MTKPSQRSGKRLLIVFLVAVALRLIVGLAFFDRIAPDPRSETTQISRSLALGRGFSDPVPGVHTGPSAWASPTYALLHAAMFRIFGVDSPASLAAMLLFNSLFSAAICLTLFFIAAELFGETLAARAAWAWALFPHAVLHSFPYSTEAALTALLVSAVSLAALRLRRSSRAAHWFGLGLLCGVLALTNTAALTVVAAPLAWLLWKSPQPAAQRMRLLATCGVALLIVLAPWLIRNYAAFGRFVFLRSNFGLELNVGNSENNNENRNHQYHPVDNPDEARRMAAIGEITYMSEKRDQAVDFIFAHPAHFLRLTLRRIAHFWMCAWDLRMQTLLARPYDTANTIFCTLVSLVGLAGLLFIARAHAPGWPLLAAILLTYPLVFYITHASMRYRHPLEPFLVMLACVALSRRRIAMVGNSRPA